MNPLNPDRMSAKERLAEVTRILALGLIRLRGPDSQDKYLKRGESCLHIPPDQSGHAKPKRRRTA